MSELELAELINEICWAARVAEYRTEAEEAVKAILSRFTLTSKDGFGD